MNEHTVEFAISLPPEFNSMDLLDPEVARGDAAGRSPRPWPTPTRVSTGRG